VVREVNRLIFGHPIVFNSLSLLLGAGFRERIDRRAIDRTLREKIDVRALVGHDPNMPIGRVSAGTLGLSVDSKGLLVVIDVPETSWGNDLLTSRARRDQTGWSFGFQTHTDEWLLDGDNTPIRTVVDMTVHEVSTCTLPAYPVTESASMYTVAHERGCGTREGLDRVLAMLQRLWRAAPEAEFRVNYLGVTPDIRVASVSCRERARTQMRLNWARQRLAEATL
jgi:HK97 family phage prohead protease